jgi:hypothetical protein
LFRRSEFELRAITQIDDTAAKGLVHRHVGVSVAPNAIFVSHRGFDTLTKDDTSVLYSVVEVDFDIAIDLEIQVDE